MAPSKLAILIGAGPTTVSVSYPGCRWLLYLGYSIIQIMMLAASGTRVACVFHMHARTADFMSWPTCNAQNGTVFDSPC